MSLTECKEMTGSIKQSAERNEEMLPAAGGGKNRNREEYNRKSRKRMAEKRALEKANAYRVAPTVGRTPSPEGDCPSLRTYQSRAAANNDPEVLRLKGFPDIKLITEQFRLMDTPSRPRSALEYIRHVNLDNSTPIQNGRAHFIPELFDMLSDPTDDDLFPNPLRSSSALRMLQSITESDDEWTFPIDDRNLFPSKDCDAVPTRNGNQNPDHQNVLDEDRNVLPGWTTLDEGGAASADEGSEVDEVDELTEDNG